MALRILIVPVFLLLAGLCPVSAVAEGGRIRVSAELDYNLTHADTEDKRSGDETETDRSFFSQQYDVEIQKELYPYLNFRTGGLFRLRESTTTAETQSSDPLRAGSREVDPEERLGRAFAELNLDNPLYTVRGSYNWSQLKDTNRVHETNPITGVFFSKSTEELFREEYDGRFRWRPEGFPSFDLEFNRFHLYDEAETRDRLDDRLKFETRYDYEGLSSDYTYTRLDSEQRIADSGSLTQIHDGGARYSHKFLGGRLSTTGAFRLRYTTLEPSGEDDVELPTSSPPVRLFSVPDHDSPSDPHDHDEGDFAALGLGVIGVTNPALAGDPVSFGIVFESETEVDTIHVLPSVRSSDLASFAWTVYISDDGMTWDEYSAGLGHEYDFGENRIEISFTRVSTRHIEVLTTSQFTPVEQIRVVQLEAFTTESSESKIENFVQNYNLGLRWAITDRTTTAYDGFYRREENEPFGRKKTTLTNSVRLQHVFNPVFVGGARVLRTDGTQSGEGDAVSHLYSASLRANYLDTLNQQFVYSGKHDKDEIGSGTTDSLILRTNADLYRDWSMNLDLGYTWRNPIEEPKGTIALLRFSTDVAPNEKLRFVMDYLASWRTEKGESTKLDQNAIFQAFWVPFRTVSLFGRVDLRKKESANEGLLVSQNYSLNWAPFPDGTLNFSFAFNQILETDDRESRIFSPQVEWQITRNSLLTVRFNIGTIESETEESDVRNLRAELKFFY